jgi:hypothetical protein
LDAGEFSNIENVECTLSSSEKIVVVIPLEFWSDQLSGLIDPLIQILEKLKFEIFGCVLLLVNSKFERVQGRISGAKIEINWPIFTALSSTG